MRKSLLIGLLASGGAAAAGIGVYLDTGSGTTSTTVTVVTGAPPTTAATSAPTDTPAASSSTATCTDLASSQGSIDSAPGTFRCGLPSHTTLQDRVYFGAYWQILDRTPATAAIVLGGGYGHARVERSSEGDFFAGIVERADPRGAVTDVVLAFAGAKGGLDAVQGEAILVGLPLDEAARAVALYDSLLADPRYANARIHVTGHSLGTGYTQYVFAHAIATYGTAATDRRADFVGFGAPNWGGSAAAHFGVAAAEVDARMVDFTAANDPVLVNGVYRIGINNYLPAFFGLTGINAAANLLAAHWPTTYASALGLPGWLAPADRAAATAAVSAQFDTGNAIDPGYGPAGTLPLTIDGGAGATWLLGVDGDDRLIGGGGGDVLTGGKGADRFIYTRADDSSPAAPDRITDFSAAEGDRIDLSAFFSLLAGPLSFRGAAPFRRRTPDPHRLSRWSDSGDRQPRRRPHARDGDRPRRPRRAKRGRFRPEAGSPCLVEPRRESGLSSSAATRS